MAAFIQDGGTNGGTYAKYFSAFLTVWENSIDVATNTSNVGYRLQLKSGSQGRFSGLRADFSVTINGVIVNNGSGTYNSQSYDTYQTICEGTTTVVHNEDGSKTINCSCVLDFQSHTYSPGDFSPSGTLALSTIPRYTKVTNSLRIKTVNSISINWTTTDARDFTQYSLNGGGWIDADDIVAPDNKSGYYIISNLQPNTSYTVKTRCKRMDSGLWSEASILNIITYDIAKIGNLPNFEHGDNLIIEITNPGDIPNLILVMRIDNKQIFSKTVTKGNNTIKFSDVELNNIYRLYGNRSSLTATFILSGSGYTNSKNNIVTLKGNQKTVKVNVKNVWKNGTLWVNIKGEWKRAVSWINVNGTWRRCI